MGGPPGRELRCLEGGRGTHGGRRAAPGPTMAFPPPLTPPPGSRRRPHPGAPQKPGRAPVPGSARPHGERVAGSRRAKGKGRPSSQCSAPGRPSETHPGCGQGSGQRGPRPGSDQSELSSLPSQEPHPRESRGWRPSGIPPGTFPRNAGRGAFSPAARGSGSAGPGHVVDTGPGGSPRGLGTPGGPPPAQPQGKGRQPRGPARIPGPFPQELWTEVSLAPFPPDPAPGCPTLVCEPVQPRVGGPRRLPGPQPGGPRGGREHREFSGCQCLQ